MNRKRHRVTALKRTKRIAIRSSNKQGARKRTGARSRVKGKKTTVRTKGLTRKAFAAGKQLSNRLPSSDNRLQLLNQHWAAWILPRMTRLGWQGYNHAAKQFIRGFNSSGIKVGMDKLLLPTAKKVGIVVTAMNEQGTLPGLLSQLNRLPVEEKIVVLNGSTDRSLEIARKQAIVIHYAEPLGHDVGRAVGAKASNADILLFVDGDFIVSAEELLPFIYAIEKGADVALNNINPWLGSFHTRDTVTIWKQFLNTVMGRSDLGSNSLTAVPHALSRKAVEQIGAVNLMIPPKAQTIAMEKGLVIQAPTSINVFKKNKKRSINTGKTNPVALLIQGDHLEAIKRVMDRTHSRLNFNDSIRKRELAGGVNL